MRKRRDYTTRLDRIVIIEKPVPSEAFDGAGSGSWEPVAEINAEVTDDLPSRGEKLSNGFTTTTRPCRVRMRYRDDITSDMRFVMGDRIMQIISGPAELGRREAIEFMVEEYRPAGNPA